MTEGKMKRILCEYIEKYGEDRAIYKVYDKYAKDKETPRIIYNIKNLLEEFNNKTGILYENFKIKPSFMSLLKRIDNDQPFVSTIVFKDTYEQWKKDNPDWEEQLKKQREKMENDYKKCLSMYKQYLKPYTNL